LRAGRAPLATDSRIADKPKNTRAISSGNRRAGAMSFRYFKQLAPPDDSTPLTPATIFLATLYGVAFALFVIWQRFLA
jgi:hypothetical protein